MTLRLEGKEENKLVSLFSTEAVKNVLFRSLIDLICTLWAITQTKEEEWGNNQELVLNALDGKPSYVLESSPDRRRVPVGTFNSGAKDKHVTLENVTPLFLA